MWLFLKAPWSRMSCWWLCKYLKCVSLTKAEINQHNVCPGISNMGVSGFPTWVCIVKRIEGMKKEGERVKRHKARVWLRSGLLSPGGYPSLSVTHCVHIALGSGTAARLPEAFSERRGGEGHAVMLARLQSGKSMDASPSHPAIHRITLSTWSSFEMSLTMPWIFLWDEPTHHMAGGKRKQVASTYWLKIFTGRKKKKQTYFQHSVL